MKTQTTFTSTSMSRTITESIREVKVRHKKLASNEGFRMVVASVAAMAFMVSLFFFNVAAILATGVLALTMVSVSE
ncbi:MAG: hypothetical protein Q4C37_00005 [Bacteroidales bacterium]|nr:hypothetical protein [Bacteroidales bacterium]